MARLSDHFIRTHDDILRSKRKVSTLVRDQLKISGDDVQALEGGRRGLRISVTLPAGAQASVAAVEQALAAYLFEAVVTVA